MSYYKLRADCPYILDPNSFGDFTVTINCKNDSCAIGCSISDLTGLLEDLNAVRSLTNHYDNGGFTKGNWFRTPELGGGGRDILAQYMSEGKNLTQAKFCIDGGFMYFGNGGAERLRKLWMAIHNTTNNDHHIHINDGPNGQAKVMTGLAKMEKSLKNSILKAARAV